MKYIKKQCGIIEALSVVEIIKNHRNKDRSFRSNPRWIKEAFDNSDLCFFDHPTKLCIRTSKGYKDLKNLDVVVKNDDGLVSYTAKDFNELYQSEYEIKEKFRKKELPKYSSAYLEDIKVKSDLDDYLNKTIYIISSNEGHLALINLEDNELKILEYENRVSRVASINSVDPTIDFSKYYKGLEPPIFTVDQLEEIVRILKLIK